MTEDKTNSNILSQNQTFGNKILPKDLVIVIGRQFGSGGRRIGKKLAKKLGISYYDSELLPKAAQRLGMNPEIFREHEEKKPSVLHTLMQGLYGIADNFHSVPMNGETIYKEQSKVIKDLCSQGPCVIVGRTADYIMRENPNIVSVFLHSPVEYRAKAIVERGESRDIQSAIDLAKRRDKERESYYNYFTCGDNWGRSSNYHLSIDTSRINEDTVADIILAFMAGRIGQ